MGKSTHRRFPRARPFDWGRAGPACGVLRPAIVCCFRDPCLPEENAAGANYNLSHSADGFALMRDLAQFLGQFAMFAALRQLSGHAEARDRSGRAKSSTLALPGAQETPTPGALSTAAGTHQHEDARVRYQSEELAKPDFLIAPQMPGFRQYGFDQALRLVPMAAKAGANKTLAGGRPGALQ